LAMTWLVASLSFRFFEEPILRWARSRSLRVLGPPSF
jgi:peptidoglycan/LPS O-acetylase OafA/YrhL